MKRVPLTVRVDPWSMMSLELRQAVYQHRLDHHVSRSEAMRRIFRSIRPRPEVKRVHADHVLAEAQETHPDLLQNETFLEALDA